METSNNKTRSAIVKLWFYEEVQASKTQIVYEDFSRETQLNMCKTMKRYKRTPKSRQVCNYARF